MRTLIMGIACLLLVTPAMAQTPDVADIAVAHIDDLGTPFDLKAHLYRPAGRQRRSAGALYPWQGRQL